MKKHLVAPPRLRVDRATLRTLTVPELSASAIAGDGDPTSLWAPDPRIVCSCPTTYRAPDVD